MTEANALLVLLGVALTVGLLGFVRAGWFFTLGYATSICMFALVTAWLYRAELDALRASLILAALIGGARLGFFLLRRDRREEYRRAVQADRERMASMGLPTKVSIWLFVSALYVCMFSPLVFLSAYANPFNSTQLAICAGGAVAAWLGLLLEAAADEQKSRQKARDPSAFTRTGLYAVVRFPNYLGEILFWTGVFAAGTVAYALWWHWALAAFGYLCILLTMLGATRRLEGEQDRRYGSEDAFAAYKQNVSRLLPGIW